MGERKHKAESGEKKEKTSKGTSKSHQATHPILQLQQLVGNKTVSNMIQRHITDEQLSQGHNVVERHREAATRGASGMQNTLTGTTEWQSGAHDSWEAFQDLIRVVNAARRTEAGEGSEQ